MTTSAFRALEMLGDDDEVPTEWTVSTSKKQTARDRGRGHAPDQAISVAGPSSMMQTQMNPEKGNPDFSKIHAGVAPDVFEIRKSANTFMQLVKREGRWEHHWLVNSLNPVTQQHNAVVRGAYKALDKAVQQYVWKMLADTTPTKRPQPPLAEHALSSALNASKAVGSISPVRGRNLASPENISAAGSHFMGLLQRHGITSQAALTNALNPASPTHVPTIRASYKTLNKKDARLAWHVLPAPMPGAASHGPGLPITSHLAPPASALKNHVQRGMSRMGSRPVPGSRPALGSRPVPGSRPSSVQSHQVNGSSRHDPIPEDPEAVLPKVSCDVPSWVSSSDPRGEDDESKLCCVCLDKPRDAMLIPCDHAVTCISCAILVKDSTGECPYCRAVIENVVCIH